ncbi:MAG TPA: hypothetical protein VMU50_05220, partial [Polyangia bacterium]|nr:hypothetical protein [Polyangia bacterium]
MIAGVLFGLGASACWALANIAVARSSRAVGAARALLWAQLVGIAVLAEAAMALDFRPVPIGGTHVMWMAL